MKKSNIKYEKPLPDKPGYCQGLQCDIEKEIQPDKIKPNEIFEGIVPAKKQVKKKVVSKETNKKANDNSKKKKKKSNY